MLAAERQAVAVGRGRSIEGPWLGVALSGGGIRSATFCLGALQQLAAADLLRHFDYMSSVSGGGYTAASAQWWWQQKPGECDASAKFPYGSELVASTKTENDRLIFLRWHASYLTPGGGISIWSAIAVVLRTLLLSLFVWIPAGMVAMLLLHTIGMFLLYPIAVPLKSAGLLQEIPSGLFPQLIGIARSGYKIPADAVISIIALAVLIAIFLAATAFLAMAAILVPPETNNNRVERITHAVKCAVLGLVLGVGLGLYLIFGLQEYGRFWQLDPQSQAAFILAVMLTAFGAAAVVAAALQIRLDLSFNYSLRRHFESGMTYLFACLLPFLILVSLPFVESILQAAIAKKGGALIGLFAVGSGLISGLYGHLVQAQRIASKYATRWFATIAAGVFIYSLILLSDLAANFLLFAPATALTLWHVGLAAAPALLLFSATFGWSSNLNSLGLHRFYRDRLMEAFLPSNSELLTGTPAFTEADRVPLSDFWPAEGKGPVAHPYPLINTNAIMIFDSRPKVALRGGDSFILSPLFVGSDTTCWADTIAHGKQHSPLTLASAMATSGAAANANAAYIGSGITRDRLISIVMMLLNMRLGLWFGAPGATWGTPNYYSPGFRYGVLRLGYKKGSNFVELTDGGHFDNLGVYELIRRRADVILVLDSEEDPSTAMAALASVCQRVQEDFDTTIDIGRRANKIAPAGDLGYPTGAKFTDAPYFVATIQYPAVVDAAGAEQPKKQGVFAYIKSNMIPGLSFPARGYKAKNPDFPNQSTMDQFFDPAQFEAYRELGYVAVQSFVEKHGLRGADAAAIRGRLINAASVEAA